VVCYGLPGMVKGSVFGHLLPKISAVIQPTNMYVGGLDYGYKKDMTICNLMGADGLFKYINVISEYGWDNYTQGHKDHFQIAKEVVAFYLELSRRYSEMRRGIIVYCDNAEQSFISILNQQANKMVIGINN
jgi:Tat protein secretion system quality control protein TatD with DNase activity